MGEYSCMAFVYASIHTCEFEFIVTLFVCATNAPLPRARAKAVTTVPRRSQMEIEHWHRSVAYHVDFDGCGSLRDLVWSVAYLLRC